MHANDVEQKSQKIDQNNMVKKDSNYVLNVKNLNIYFKISKKQKIHVVRGIDLKVAKSQIVGLVGESGSGKTVTSKSFLGINFNDITSSDKMDISGIDASKFIKNKDWLKIRGKKVGYIPQDPLTALNPTRTIGKQLLDVLHKDPRFKTKKEKIDYLVDILETFGIRDARSKFNSYPHTFSGGMKQRVVIAMVVALNPDLIIADEPTTALDPTVQASVLSLLDEIREKYKIAIIFISHNISVVAKFCDYIYVMYAGKVVEKGTRRDIFTNPKHPYTWALISAIPENKEKALYTIKGTPPDMANLPPGDAFAPRNEYALDLDYVKEPPFFKISSTHSAATWLLHEKAPKIELKESVVKRLESFRKVFNE
ncbi:OLIGOPEPTIDE ABC TRANSPORTER ATP-BINDING PROTEIN [Mycoplasmopsis pulmonis]|uniref:OLIGOPEPTIDE ABC TRANSPORTER ATP-BINDING PROTEIN n=2 Tax=Mycoplasmopsis pulmonis TaxID=2107 RepID=Q98QS6_MYCPU|nr:ABC transporter ATP-binding protein [Mycoplasmopsis pulmonis]CAC13458.1 OLIGOPEPTIDE ABC TRANSPORTER ATP-BINDING PROTEIN [Mycoplasmopsis pulmonis]